MIHTEIIDYGLAAAGDDAVELMVHGAERETVTLTFERKKFMRMVFALLNKNRKPRRKKS